MNDQEIKKRFEDIEKRLDLIENKRENERSKKASSKSLKGIVGGIQELIDSSFFDSPKSISEVIEKLKVEGHFGSKQTIDASVRKDFFKRKRILTRIKEGKTWKYVIRK